jgi:MFS transporter, NNP family, nitrate/nitrite transporter
MTSIKGSTFGIEPYVDPPSTGSITGTKSTLTHNGAVSFNQLILSFFFAGIVGAGGTVGAVGYGMAFSHMKRNKDAMILMGVTVLASSILSLFIVIEGQDSVLFQKCGKNKDEDKHAETS